MQTTGPGPDSPLFGGHFCYHCSIRRGMIQEISTSTGVKYRKDCGDV